MKYVLVYAHNTDTHITHKHTHTHLNLIKTARFESHVHQSEGAKAEPPTAQAPATVSGEDSSNHQGSVDFPGQNNSDCQSNQVAPLHFRSLQRMVNSVFPIDVTLDQIREKYNTLLPLSAEAQQELQWWYEEVMLHNEAPIQPPTPDWRIETDALNWGGVQAVRESRQEGCGTSRNS